MSVRIVPALTCLVLTAPLLPALSQEPPATLSRYAAACDLAARQTLVSTMAFSAVAIDDYTRDGDPEVDVVYDAISKSSGKVYPSTFTCTFADLKRPDNIVLIGAAEGGRPYGIAAVAALNRLLKESGFQN
ncbi:MAG: hypothetical protein U1E56_04605 [Bauldia sp.]